VCHTKGRTDAALFEKRALKKICETKKEEVTDELRKLHNEKCHNLCSTTIIRMITRMSWAGHVACMGDMKAAHTTLDEKPEEK
jgi:hypothetical protein